MLLMFTIGCDLRAYLFGQKITEVLKEMLPEENFPPPYKQFVFGRLTFNTDNALKNKNGVRQVAWEYHVAPVIGLAENTDSEKRPTLYILDPAMSAEPILRDDWYRILTKNNDSTDEVIIPSEKTGSVTCHSDTVSLKDHCFRPDPTDDDKKFKAFKDETLQGNFAL